MRTHHRSNRGIVALILAAAFVAIVAAEPVRACIWDDDTLRMEEREFPDAREMIAGRFLRHGKAFYRWRIADRERKLAAAPDDLALHDDLAVAYEKTAQPRKAIEIMERKAKLKPGDYKTAANLGTFYIHAGDLETGLKHIKQAIAINPEAHFGREIYQQLLVEYVIEKKRGGALELPMKRSTGHSPAKRFDDFVIAKRETALSDEPDAVKRELQAAVKGVLGMMRFGNHASPVLLEALGDLLGRDVYDEGGAKRLAARAYLRASYVTKGDVSAAYRTLAQKILAIQRDGGGGRSMKLTALESKFQKELEEAQTFADEVRANEADWLENEADPERKFAEVYYGQKPVVAPSKPDGFVLPRWLIILGVLFALNIITLITVRKRRPAKRRTYGRRRRS